LSRLKILNYNLLALNTGTNIHFTQDVLVKNTQVTSGVMHWNFIQDSLMFTPPWFGHKNHICG